MPKVLILVDHRPKRSPSQRYRFEQYLDYLTANGFEFTWSYLLNEKDDQLFYSKGNFFKKISILIKSVFIRLADVKRFKDFDIIFIQREALFLGSSYFEKKAFRLCKKVIFDFDDSIWLSDTSPGNKKWEWVKKPEKFFTNIKHAHLVIAGNSYLAEKVKSFNASYTIIPTTIDTDLHKPLPQLRNKQPLIIGWSGSISTIKHFEEIVPVLERIKQKHGDAVSFKVLGDVYYQNRNLKIKGIRWEADKEVAELNSFDIGIMPLPDNEWTKGKCGLKGLSYMACGIPTVMSEVGINKEIVEHGVNGFLAKDQESWFKYLDLLIQDKELRIKMGESGRQTVLDRYSVKANCDKYLKAFQNA